MEKLKFEANIDTSTIEKLNSEFSIAKCYIMYHGDNRNNSNMSKEVVEKALPSLFNVPVIGEFIEKKEDWGGHGGKLVIDSNGIEFIQTTSPFGVVPESSNPRWEIVTHEDGVEKEYLVADVILWSGRYEELNVTIDNYSQQSMEINILDGDFNNKDVFEIEEFEFSALCLLGLDVEPCFEQSKVVAYSLDEFKNEMDLFMSKYKEFNKRKENEMDKVNKKVEEVIEDSTEDVNQEDNFENSSQDANTDTDDNSDVDVQENPEEFEVSEEVEEYTEETKSEELFSLTAMQKLDSLSNALDSEVVRDEDGRLVSETYYWVQDYDENYVYFTQSEWNMEGDYERKDMRATYSFNEDETANVNKADKEQVFFVRMTKEEKDELENKRNEDMSNLQDQFNSINEELDNYKAKERQEAENEIFSMYEEVLKDNANFDALKEKSNEYSLDELKKELALIYVESNNTFTKKESTKDALVVEKVSKKEEKVESRYGDLFEQYGE